MGNYDSIGGIVLDIKKFKAIGMSDEEIEIALYEYGVR